jgi:glutaredoxin
MIRANGSSVPRTVVFYTKAGCHLCDDARDLLEELAASVAFELTEIDIRTDLSIFEEYRYRIPVIIIDGQTTIEGRISLADLRRAFFKE